MFETSSLIIGLLTSAVGLAYIAYGRRQVRYAPLLCGIALCAYSWFFDNWIWLVTIGAALMAIPFFVDG